MRRPVSSGGRKKGEREERKEREEREENTTEDDIPKTKIKDAAENSGACTFAVRRSERERKKSKPGLSNRLGYLYITIAHRARVVALYMLYAHPTCGDMDRVDVYENRRETL